MPKLIANTHGRATARLMRLAALAAWLWVTGLAAAPSAQLTFASPEAGVNALIRAAQDNDILALEAILGPDSGDVISSGDSIEDAHNRRIFLHIYETSHALVFSDATHGVLIVGRGKMPMPIPLVKEAGAWRFDTKQGRAAILQRRIERNERDAMQVCLAIVYAERQFAAENPGNGGAPVYASHLRSTPGRHDGLYWPTTPGERPSLLGVLLADAAVHDGYEAPGASTATPYLGYIYRIVMQPPVEKRARFVVMAYPAVYSVSGIRSFVAGVDGVVYGKDLGAYTATIVATTDGFRLEDGWQVSQPVD
ncbi:MAG TPA: DUF2950 family protein [Dyella sp.]|uniref:DUF2950 family protein n=1 Tax=Dyella sp. TaxID=1869338 RepID=UPI002C776D30|nr:DUF2950 family protein [Dyella sp.]HTV84654.1 DUF2950 family protein [Dyella sp.]